MDNMDEDEDFYGDSGDNNASEVKADLAQGQAASNNETMADAVDGAEEEDEEEDSDSVCLSLFRLSKPLTEWSRI